MDRFIGQGSGITSDIITDLKSNMDRFIELKSYRQHFEKLYLKSNMDRFIEYTQPFAYCFLNI